MTHQDYLVLLKANINKMHHSLFLVRSSLQDLALFNANINYTPKELEPYDALSDRFIRAVETAIKCFRSYELYMYAETSNTLRDLLLRIEKNSIITSTDLWIEMRDVRNRIVHDYLPEQLGETFNLITNTFSPELFFTERAFDKVVPVNTGFPPTRE